MCGITGFIDRNNNSSESILRDMVKTLHHRGPDDSGTRMIPNDKVQVGLGHTRLAVIDISSAGHQPMRYKHLTIVYNGEIYNYKELKSELYKMNHRFQSDSDTEVILHAFEQWGTDCVDKFIGMFSFCIYDEDEEVFYAFRDRAGVKPLYFYYRNGLFLFSSELKAFHKHTEFEKNIDGSALDCYFDIGYIPSPYCIFQNTYKLNPGHYLKYDISEVSLDIIEYWNAGDFYQNSKRNISYEQAKIDIENLMISAFNYRMVADVPVGIFLSGGYDSSAVAALLQKGRTEKLKTFTIGFEQGNNEAPFARKIASYLDTDHHEYICTPNEAQDIIPDLPYYYDEPFADSSAIPTLLVSRFARQHVTVALSADGSDELFAGYNRYHKLIKYQARLNLLPSFLKGSASFLAGMISEVLPTSMIRRKHHFYSIANSLHSNKAIQNARLYKSMKLLPKVYKKQLFNREFTKYTTELDSHIVNSVEQALLTDYKMYLPDDILTKVDRATMSTSLEGRDPMMDHRLLEYAAQLPLSFKFGDLGGKQILKEIVHSYIPIEIMNRPKSGFSIPFSHWFQGELNPLLHEHINKTNLKRSGILQSDFVLERVKEFEEGNLHYTPLIWKVLMFQMWYDYWCQ